MKQNAWEYLHSDFPLHADMLTLLDREETEVLYAAGDGVVIQWDTMREISTATETQSLKLMPLLAGGREIVLHQPYLLDLLENRYRLMMTCYNYAYLGGGPLPVDLPEGFSMEMLTQAHADFVHAHYHNVDDLDYIRERIEEGMLGAFCGEELAGFIGVHDEGSIGLLEVLPQYRRHGLAEALEGAMVNRRLSQGRIPFGQVNVDNEASNALQHKLNMTRSQTPVYWLKANR